MGKTKFARGLATVLGIPYIYFPRPDRQPLHEFYHFAEKSFHDYLKLPHVVLDRSLISTVVYNFPDDIDEFAVKLIAFHMKYQFKTYLFVPKDEETLNEVELTLLDRYYRVLKYIPYTIMKRPFYVREEVKIVF